MANILVGREQLRDPEVEQLRKRRAVRVVREKNILGLEIAMGDALGVRGVERFRECTQDRNGLGQR